jgi:hypothetical protein
VAVMAASAHHLDLFYPVQTMFTLEERKRRGEETLKKYLSLSGNDAYSRAVDAITDILLSVAQNEDEGNQMLHCAEMDFRNAVEGEQFVTEG